MSFYQRSLALFFGELPGPPVDVVDAREQVAGATEKGLRVTASGLDYASFWFVKDRAWHVAHGGRVTRTPVPSSAVIYEVGTEVVAGLFRASIDQYLAGPDRSKGEANLRDYEAFLQDNIPQGLAGLKAHGGVERARVLLDELRREFQERATAAAAAARSPAASRSQPSPAPAAPPSQAPAAEPAAVAEQETRTPARPAPAVPPPPTLGGAVRIDTGAIPVDAPAPTGQHRVVGAATGTGPVAVTVRPQTTAGFVFDPSLVNLLGRLGSMFEWLMPDYGRHGETMGVRVTLPAEFSILFTHEGPVWTASSLPHGDTAVERIDGDDAVVAWAVTMIRTLTTSYATSVAGSRPADAAQLFQRVADLG